MSLFPKWYQCFSCGFYSLSLCQHYLFPLRLRRWHDWSPPSTGTAAPSLPLVPVPPGGCGTIAVYGCRHELRSEGQGAHPLHPPRDRDRHFHGLQRLDVPLHSCGPRTALAGAQGALLHPPRQGQGVGKGFAQEEAMKVGLLETPSKGRVSFCLSSGHVVLTAFFSKIWWTSSLLHSTIAQSGENTFCCWAHTKSCSIDLVTLSCSCETAKGQNAFQQKHISPVQRATQAPHLCADQAAMHVGSRFSIKKLPNQLPLWLISLTYP